MIYIYIYIYIYESRLVVWQCMLFIIFVLEKDVGFQDAIQHLKVICLIIFQHVLKYFRKCWVLA